MPRELRGIFFNSYSLIGKNLKGHLVAGYNNWFSHYHFSHLPFLK